MPRQLSAPAIESINAEESGEIFLVLLTIAHPKLTTPLRVVGDGKDLVSRGNLFFAYDFGIEFPQADADRPPRARLRIANVHRDIIAAIRQMDSAPSVTIEIVLASSPDVVEISYADFKLRRVSFDAYNIEGDLVFEDISARPYPPLRFMPSTNPGLF